MSQTANQIHATITAGSAQAEVCFVETQPLDALFENSKSGNREGRIFENLT
jgi:hypothetical protein